jgi:hypothetical protein
MNVKAMMHSDQRWPKVMTYAVLAGSSDQEVTSPVKPASSDEAMVVDMHGHPYDYYISQHSMDRLKSGQGICDEMVNFCLDLLQVEAKYTAAKESWAFTSSGVLDEVEVSAAGQVSNWLTNHLISLIVQW